MSERLTRINRRAPIRVVDHGKIDLAELLDVRGFNLNADLGGGVSLRPVSKAPSIDRISSLVLRTDKPLDIDKLSEFMNELLEEHGKQLLRYKGVLNIAWRAAAHGVSGGVEACTASTGTPSGPTMKRGKA